MPTFPTLSTGSQWQYPVKRTLIQRAGTHTFCDGSFLGYKKGSPLVEFEFNWDKLSTANKNLIRNFYASVHGEGDTNWDLEFDGITYVNCQFVGQFEPSNSAPKLWDGMLRVRAMAQPPNVPVSGTLFLTSAHYPNPSSAQWGGGAGLNDNISLFTPHPTWFEDPGTWDKRTDSHTLTVGELATLRTGGTYLLLDQFHVGTGVGPYSPPDEFWIYDCYMILTMTDGTTQTWRPHGTAVHGTVVNPANAIDTNDATYAIIRAGGYALAADGSYLNLNSFGPVS